MGDSRIQSATNFMAALISNAGNINAYDASKTTQFDRDVNVQADNTSGQIHVAFESLSDLVDNDLILYANPSQLADYAPSDPFGSDACLADHTAVYNTRSWPLGGGGAGTIYDLGPNGYDATVLGSGNWMSLTSGLIDQALSFEDTKQNYADTVDFTRATQAFSVSAWVRFDSIDPTDGAWIANQRGNATNDKNWQLTVFDLGGGLHLLATVWDTAGTIHFVEGSTVPSTGTWYHTALTADDTDVNTYLNAGDKATTAIGATLENANKHLRIAARGWIGSGNIGNFFGDMNMLRMANWKKSQEELELEYNNFNNYTSFVTSVTEEKF